MSKFGKGSFWLGMLEDIVYIFPTLGTVMYYYFSEIQNSVKTSSKYTFALALVLFVLFCILKKVSKTKIDELRQSVVQTETDLKNTPDEEIARRERLAVNAKRDRRTLDIYDKGAVMITLLIFALGVHILEQALIGLTNLAYIACGSVLGGFGIHLGVLELKSKEAVKAKRSKK